MLFFYLFFMGFIDNEENIECHHSYPVIYFPLMQPLYYEELWLKSSWPVNIQYVMDKVVKEEKVNFQCHFKDI